MKSYIIQLSDEKQYPHHFELFWNDKELFTLTEAKDHIKLFERAYPDNIGYYKIFKLVEVSK